MKNFFVSMLFVLIVGFAGAQNSFAQQSPSGAAGDPTHVAIDGPVMVQLSPDPNRPRRVVVSNGPSVRREAGARASADAELERKLAVLRQQMEDHNATTDSRLSSAERQITILESRGVSPNDPQIVALRDEMRELKAAEQSNKDWRWILLFLSILAILIAIFAFLLRGGSSGSVTQTVTINNGKGKGKGAKVVNSTGTPTLSAKTPKSEQASDVPAPAQQAAGDRPPPPGRKDITTAGNFASIEDLNSLRSEVRTSIKVVQKEVVGLKSSITSQFEALNAKFDGLGSASNVRQDSSTSPAPKQVEDPNFHITSISEKEGPSSGGQIVKILGPGVDKADKVNFSGTIECLAKIIEKAENMIKVITPPHRGDTVSVCLQIDGPPRKRAWAGRAYTFIDPPVSNEPANPPEDGVTVPFVPKTNESNEPFNNSLADALKAAAIETPKAEEPAATTNEKVAE